jgi:hypothetical protein
MTAPRDVFHQPPRLGKASPVFESLVAERPLRVLVCGSRTWTNADLITHRIAQLPWGSTVIHGGAEGADELAHAAACVAGLATEVYCPAWGEYGRAAGPIRNRAMLDSKPDLVIAFQVGQSRGTQDVIDEARRRGFHVEVTVVPPP